MSKEFAAKLEQVRQVVKKAKAEGALIGKQSNFSWLSCGGEAHVPLNSDVAFGRLLVTESDIHVIANRIEMPRLKQEALRHLRVKPSEHPWHDEKGAANAVKEIANPKKLISDTGEFGSRNRPELFKPLRGSFHREEVKRYRELGADAEIAMNAACQAIEPDQSEFEIAGHLSACCLLLDITPVVQLIAVDERIRRFRHPVPTGKQLKETAMLVLCGRRGGQIVSLTRIVTFRKLSKELRKRHRAVSAVNTAFQQSTIVGKFVKTAFKRGVEEYSKQRYEKEWELHHQGGPCGYETRDSLAGPDVKGKVLENQPFAWNPSITGTKSEDTILVTKEGVETITAGKDWPMVTTEWDGKKHEQPDILIR